MKISSPNSRQTPLFRTLPVSAFIDLLTSFNYNDTFNVLNHSVHRFSANPFIKRLFYPFVFSILMVGIGCSSDDDKMNPPAQTYMANFKLSGDGYNETVTYNSDDNLIFCRLTGDDMWVRLARDKTANGDNGPHIDIDICNYGGAGSYSPVDPQTLPCPSGPLWKIFWHDGSKTYSNQESSFPCQLTLTLDGDILSGVFFCNDVIRFQGTEIIEIREGTFSCKIE